MILRALNRRTAPYLSGADRQYGQLEVNEAIRARLDAAAAGGGRGAIKRS